MSQKVIEPQKHSGGGITAIFVSSIGCWHVPRVAGRKWESKVGEAVGEKRAHLRITGKEDSHHCYDLVTNHMVKEAGEVGDLKTQTRKTRGRTGSGWRQKKEGHSG